MLAGLLAHAFAAPLLPGVVRDCVGALRAGASVGAVLRLLQRTFDGLPNQAGRVSGRTVGGASCAARPSSALALTPPAHRTRPASCPPRPAPLHPAPSART